MSSRYEFQVESHISSKELNHQSVSLVIPRLTRDKIHSMIYYKTNLSITSLRGDTMCELSRVLIRDLGTLHEISINQVYILGGAEFKCLLMKLVEIKPSFEQLEIILNIAKRNTLSNFNDKYIAALILIYIRIQYYYLRKNDKQSLRFRELFKEYINDYRKVKCVDFEFDCWSISQQLEVSVKYLDELIDWLVKKNELWGIPLGRCQWCNIYSDESESESESHSENDDNTDSDGNSDANISD